MLEPELKEQFIMLRAQGLSYGKIAGEIDVSKSTLINWGKDFDVEITARRDEYLEELREKYLMSEAQRIKLFGQRLEKIREEIEKKGLDDLKTDQLLALEAKLMKCLEG